MIGRSCIFIVAAVVSCSFPSRDTDADSAKSTEVPAPLSELAQDALRAAAEVKQSGNIDSVLAAHPLSGRYRDALRQHLVLMKKLHSVAVDSRISYPAYALEFAPAEFCILRGSAKLLLRGVATFTMEPTPPNSGTPPYTAATEEHIFEFKETAEGWIVSRHHEISLAEGHSQSARRLRHPCA